MVEQSADVYISGPDEAPVSSGTAESPAQTETERKFAEVLADLVKAESVPVDSHFFNDLGANSLVMAQFCARIRKRTDLPSASMKDIYRSPTVRSLAAALAQTASAPAAPALQPAPAPATPATAMPKGKANHVLCGSLQLLIFLAYSFAAGLVTARGFEWVAAASGFTETYLRSLIFGSIGFTALCVFPVVAKWLLVGRWKPQEFPVWSLAYLRFWFVKVLLHANPMILFIGNPLYVLYLRALGARIGKGVTILSHAVPVCTDLLTIGDGVVIRKDSYFLCYRAHAGRIQTGRVTFGRDAFVGEKAVLDIDTEMGDGTQLGHASALYRGQRIPDGERWHGSPAQPTQTDYLRVPPARCGRLRRIWFGLGALLQLYFLYLPLGLGGTYILFTNVPEIGTRLKSGAAGLSSAALLSDALVLSLLLFFGFTAVGLVVLFMVPRLLSLAVRPGRVYPLYGFHYVVHRAVARMTNIKFFAWLFGDSSYVVYYLRGLGYHLNKVDQTGSNFGSEFQHETPFLVSIGSGTMVADGLSVLNAEYSSTSFRVSQATIGPRNFLGNNIAYPAGGRTGDNCLLATKVMVPLDGEIREGVGLLGSPCFEIPRSVERDSRFDDLRTGETKRRRLAAKNRHNLGTMVLMLGVRWLHSFVLTIIGLAAVELYGVIGHVVIAGYLALSLAVTTLHYVLAERIITRFRPLQPKLCSIYDPYFWWHERLWKVPDQYLEIFNGTPFKSLVWRMLGVRMGRAVFDDGCFITERTLAAIGDGCTLNQGSKIQCHSQEDGTFKSDRTALGAGCTVGVSAHVHYGVTMGDGALLAPDSFLMKGEEVPAHAQWGGNPAADLPAAPELTSGAGAPAAVVRTTATPSVNGSAASVS
ncbi:Pls/PosA family non-ribosomal peptide synthetase [Streptomyces sp. NPDC002514]|uniref:Pls/PosA family non-ribosomal peptide synthetase n=1 Tax=Streptomyces sp. NPDC001270 TaxID=3364554 RepID=UPI0036C6ABBC